ncbi:rRNA maturation RNase YbeY [Pseudoroseicyclus aestuarii]|uniref:Endoribonuclease YbeY n=1 Tax=Pseudoroseicyclus aestuarii TaxID=1795041 RepID=A0A318SRU1_9RHOB|nr:rRNA maturation RNase YbeY [Pseudoroseicyclus aestuarii]PYE84065.1 putative rRNA maturation factor [Pseudoroseicyclus aestuarii]
MTVETMIEDSRWGRIGLEPLAEKAAAAVLTRLGLKPARFEISLLGCSDSRIAELNADFRGKPKATNVLSWPSEERGAERAGAMPQLPEATGPMAQELGDIAIAYETCMAEAEAGALRAEAHVLHLLVHAVLHLLGFDHETEADAGLMEGLETEILGKLGVADPYSGAQ